MNSDLDRISAELATAADQAAAVVALISMLIDHRPMSDDIRELAVESAEQQRAIVALSAEPVPTRFATRQARRHLAALDTLLLGCIEEYAEHCRAIADRLAVLEEFHSPDHPMAERALRLSWRFDDVAE